MPRLVSPVLPRGRLADIAQPTFSINGLVVRPWEEADAPSLVAAFQDPEIQQWRRRVLTSRTEAEELVSAQHAQWKAETGASWAVVDAANAAVVGEVGLRGIELGDGCAQFAYWVLPSARGRGIATSASHQIVAWCFEDLGLHRLELAHGVVNESSCRVAVKLGFPLEGIKKSALLHPDGWHDMHLHARINTADGS